MAQCIVCSNPRGKEVNRWLLTGRQITETAKEFGFKPATLSWHRRNHLPWRSRRAPKPQTIMEELELMEFELRTLTVLSQCGEPIGSAIQALTARRAVLELRARLEGRLDATHRKLALANRAPEGDFEVVFSGGKARTVEAGKT
jgi:hypothetical protein